MNNKLTVKNLLDSTLDFFASVKLSIFLLLTVAATSVIGTLIPQEASLREHYQNFGPTLFKVFDALGFFNVYQAKWFQFLLGLLALNLIVCTFKRLPITWKIVTLANPGFSRGKFDSIKQKYEFKLDMAPQQVQAKVLDIVTSRFRTVTEGSDGDDYTLYAEKGRWTRMGFYMIHMAFLLILLGAILGSVFGYSGFLNLQEGESASAVMGKDNLEISLPFTIKCDDFEVEYYEGKNSISEFTSDVTITEPGKDSWKTDIRVNHPLRLHGVSLYQANYGVSHYTGTVDVQFKDPATGNTEKVSVPISQRVPLPWDKGTFMIPSYIEHLHSRDGHEMGPAVRVHMFPENGQPEVFMMPVGRPEFMQERMGLEVVVAGSSGIAPVYYTGLKVTKDPGVWVVYSGFILILVGCLITFFMAHNQLYIKISPAGKKSLVEIRGTANKNPQGFEERVRRIARRIENKE